MTTFTTQDRQDAQRTPLTYEQIEACRIEACEKYIDETLFPIDWYFARAIERAHGIGE